MKISGGSGPGTWVFATPRSMLSTARKQDRCRIEALRAGPEALLTSPQQPLTRLVLDSENQPSIPVDATFTI